MKKQLLFTLAVILAMAQAVAQAPNPCQQVIAVLNSVSVEPTTTVDNEVFYDICQGESISFSGSGSYPQSSSNVGFYVQDDASSTFLWLVGNEASIDGQGINYTFNNEGVFVVNLVVTDNNDCSSTNFFNLAVRVSTTPDISLNASGDLLICPDETTIINTNIQVFPTTAQAVCENEVSGITFLPDGENTGGGVFSAYETPVNLECFGEGQELEDVNDLLRVCLEMEHSFIGDLTINLFSPDGSQVSLLPDENGGGVGNGLGGGFLGEPDGTDGTGVPGIPYIYCWSPNATVGEIQDVFPGGTLAASNPVTNTNIYTAANNSFNDVVGSPLNGPWTIEVIDSWGADDGYIFSWWIDFNATIVPPLYSFTPEIVEQGWDPHPVISSYTDTELNIVGSVSGTHDLNYSVTDNFGCTYAATIQVVVTDEIQIQNLQIENKICRSIGSIDFDVIGGFGPVTIEWEHGPVGVTSFTDIPSGDYTVTITDAENCSITETFTIPDEHIDIEMELTDYLDDHCNQGIGYINLATTNGVAPYTFDWYRNGEFMTTTSEPILNNLFEGTYTIEATDVNTCTGTYEVILEDVPEPDAFFELRADVDFVEEIIFVADQTTTDPRSQIVSLEWSFGDGNFAEGENAENIYQQPGDYIITLTATDNFGCIGVHQETITIKAFNIFTPTAFSPNNDGINEEFRPIINEENFYNYQLFIFDRWGKQVFSSRDYTDGWNGYYADEVVAEPGLYVFKLSYNTEIGTRRQLDGLVHLLR